MVAIRILIFLLLFALPVQAGDWEDVCGVLGVKPTEVQRPVIQVVTREYYRMRCAPGGDAMACYDWVSNTVYITKENLVKRNILIHEYAHAVMFQEAFQEMMAGWVERQLGGEK